MTRILIVDDSKTIRRAIRGIMESIGAEADEAENGQVAVEKVNSSSFDAVLLDWNMPVMNGLDCLKEIRANPEHDDLRILMVTTEDSFDQITTALNSGADEYVIKPFDTEIIQGKLESVGVVV